MNKHILNKHILSLLTLFSFGLFTAPISAKPTPVGQKYARQQAREKRKARAARNPEAVRRAKLKAQVAAVQTRKQQEDLRERRQAALRAKQAPQAIPAEYELVESGSTLDFALRAEKFLCSPMFYYAKNFLPRFIASPLSDALSLGILKGTVAKVLPSALTSLGSGTFLTPVVAGFGFKTALSTGLAGYDIRKKVKMISLKDEDGEIVKDEQGKQVLIPHTLYFKRKTFSKKLALRSLASYLSVNGLYQFGMGRLADKIGYDLRFLGAFGAKKTSEKKLLVSKIKQAVEEGQTVPEEALKLLEPVEKDEPEAKTLGTLASQKLDESRSWILPEAMQSYLPQRVAQGLPSFVRMLALRAFVNRKEFIGDSVKEFLVNEGTWQIGSRLLPRFGYDLEGNLEKTALLKADWDYGSLVCCGIKGLISRKLVSPLLDVLFGTGYPAPTASK